MTLFDRAAAIITPGRVAAFQNWRRQPTTVAGLATVSGSLTGYAMHQLTFPQFVFALVGGLVALVLPDNSDRKTSTVPAAVAAARPGAAP